MKSKLIKGKLFNNRRWWKANKFFESGARKQTPNLEIQICFHLQLLALDHIALKYASELNKQLLLMWPSFQCLSRMSMLCLDYW